MEKDIYKSPRTVLVCVASFDPSTSEPLILTIKRNDALGLWQSVTGSYDSSDENSSATAKREINEELGWDLDLTYDHNIFSYLENEANTNSNPFDRLKNYLNVSVKDISKFYDIPEKLNWGSLVEDFTTVSAQQPRTGWFFNLHRKVTQKIFPEYRHLYPSNVDNIIEEAFLLVVNKFNPKLGNEHSELKWLPLDQAIEIIGFPSNKDLIIKLFKGHKL